MPGWPARREAWSSGIASGMQIVSACHRWSFSPLPLERPTGYHVPSLRDESSFPDLLVSLLPCANPALPNQPAGLKDGSRWSFLCAERPPECGGGNALHPGGMPENGDRDRLQGMHAAGCLEVAQLPAHRRGLVVQRVQLIAQFPRTGQRTGRRFARIKGWRGLGSFRFAFGFLSTTN